jgi:nucleoside phosphorylase
MSRAKRPATRDDFKIVIVCALAIEANAVTSLFDDDWDDGDEAHASPYDSAAGDPNAYSAGRIGRHDVVVAYMPGMGKVHAATVAAHCRSSWPTLKLALVVGICGVVPFPSDGKEIILGDVIISSGVVQYDLGRRLPENFVRKNTLPDSLGGPGMEIRSLLAKLQGIRDKKKLLAKMRQHLKQLQEEPELRATYPGTEHDCLFEATYRHVEDGKTCGKAGCSGQLLKRGRLEQDLAPTPMVHFGLVASGDTVMKSGKDRDDIAQREDVIAYEMEGAGFWGTFPCLIIKGACDYADSHKTKKWQNYAAATAASCTKAYLEFWTPSSRAPDTNSITVPVTLQQPKVVCELIEL